MKVSELAGDLGLPPSAVIEQCQRFGIDASWAGAELRGADVVILRAELASGDEPLDLTSADDEEQPPTEAVAEVPREIKVDGVPPAAPRLVPSVPSDGVPSLRRSEPAAAGAAAGVAAGAAAGAGSASDTSAPASAPATDADRSLPPTAVASKPELVDALTPTEPPAIPGPGGFRMAGAPADQVKPTVGEASLRRSAEAATDRRDRRFDPGIRNAIVALLIAVGLLFAASALASPWPDAFLWLLVAVALVSSLVSAGRAWYRTSTHPEKIRGLYAAMALLLVASLATVGFGFAVWTVVRAEPAASAPFGLGDQASVQRLRWGFDRVTLVAHNGWDVPAKLEGTCWRERELNSDQTGPRDPNRKQMAASADPDVPQAPVEVDCTVRHSQQAFRTITISRDADAPYGNVDPDAKADRGKDPRQVMAKLAQDACSPELLALSRASGESVTLLVEYPSRANWADGDHDLTCLALTRTRTGEMTVPAKTK